MSREYVSLRVLRFTLVALILSLVSVLPPASAKGRDIQDIRRVGVLSLTGDVLFHRQIGVTAFGNDAESFDVTEWGLDAAWELKIKEAASSLGDFEFVEIEVDRAPLIATYPKENAWPRQWRTLSFKKAAPLFLQIAQENNLDALIILGGFGYDIIEDRIGMEGVGIFTTKRLGGTGAVYHVVSQLALIDGDTGKPIKKQTLSVGSHWTEAHGGYPVQEAPEELSKLWYSDYSDEEKEALRASFIAFPDAAWERSLTKLLIKK